MTAAEYRALGEPICDDPSDPCFGIPERHINRSQGYDASRTYIPEDDLPFGWDDWHGVDVGRLPDSVNPFGLTAGEIEAWDAFVARAEREPNR